MAYFEIGQINTAFVWCSFAEKSHWYLVPVGHFFHSLSTGKHPLDLKGKSKSKVMVFFCHPQASISLLFVVLRRFCEGPYIGKETSCPFQLFFLWKQKGKLGGEL